MKIWREDTWFLDWCKTKPELSGENLTTYFYFTRTSLDEKISRISSFLSPVAQEILEQLLSKTDVKIKKALEAAVNISDAEAEAVLEAMYSSMSAETTISKETMKAFVEFSQKRANLSNDTISYLQSFSGSQISLGCVPYIAGFCKKSRKGNGSSRYSRTVGKNNTRHTKCYRESIEKIKRKEVHHGNLKYFQWSK